MKTHRGPCRRRKGSVLIIVLLLLSILFIMGMAMLGIKATQARSSVLMKNSLIARQLALSGMEDARVKLCKDMNFPPRGSLRDFLFSYSEKLQYPGDSMPAGEYEVTIDTSWNEPANSADYDQKILVISVGIVRDTAGSITARHRMSAFLDTSEILRGGAAANPYLYQYIDWQDHGGL